MKGSYPYRRTSNIWLSAKPAPRQFGISNDDWAEPPGQLGPNFPKNTITVMLVTWTEQARLRGKGNKIRLCPLWPKTAKYLRTLIDRQELGNTELSNAFVFKNRAGGQPLARCWATRVSRPRCATPAPILI